MQFLCTFFFNVLIYVGIALFITLINNAMLLLVDASNVPDSLYGNNKSSLK